MLRLLLLWILLPLHLRRSRKRGSHNEKTHGSWSPNNPFANALARQREKEKRSRKPIQLGPSRKMKMAGMRKEAEKKREKGQRDERRRGIPEKVLEKHPQLAELGPLRIEEYDHPEIQKHVDDLAKVPTPIAQAVRDRGLRDIHIAPRPMPSLDNNQGLKGVRPRGWPEGSTWDIVPGAYNPKEKSVAAGYTPQGHGARSLALHEYGHAIDDAFKLRRTPNFRELHRKNYDDMTNPYYRQGGPGGDAGVSEMIAEGFALWALDGKPGLRRKFGTNIADGLDDLFTRLTKELQ